MTRKRFLTWILIFTGFLLLCTALSTYWTQGRQKQAELFPNRSIYNNKTSGYRAWASVLDHAHIPYTSWRLSFQALDKLTSPSSMLLIEPDLPNRELKENDETLFSPQEIQALRKWIQEGNTLILLDSFEKKPMKAFLHGFLAEIEAYPISPDAEEFMPFYESSTNHSFSSKLQPLPVLSKAKQRLRFKPHPLQQISPLLQDDAHRFAVLRFAYGKGSIILGTLSDIGSNQFLFQTGQRNYQWLSDLLLNEKKAILLNEAVHGIRDDRDALSYFAKTPFQRTLFFLMLLLLSTLWYSFKRWRPKQYQSKALPLSNDMRFVESIAELYEREQLLSAWSEPLLNEIDTRLKQHYGISITQLDAVKQCLEDLTQDSKLSRHLTECIKQAQQLQPGKHYSARKQQQLRLAFSQILQLLWTHHHRHKERVV